MHRDYLERILAARVYDVAIETPLELAPALSARLENRLLLKREDVQPVFSFKLRGAYNKMARLPPARLREECMSVAADRLRAEPVTFPRARLERAPAPVRFSTVIERRPSWQPLDLIELWRFRELLFFLAWRDVQLRYRQTALGAAWAVLQPLATMLVMVLFMHRLAPAEAAVPDASLHFVLPTHEVALR